jgi:hypothetical protein
LAAPGEKLPLSAAISGVKDRNAIELGSLGWTGRRSGPSLVENGQQLKARQAQELSHFWQWPEF